MTSAGAGICLGLVLAGAVAVAAEPTPAPVELRIGNLVLKPSGFLEVIGEIRSATSTDSISTRFGSIPLTGSPAESIASPAHSRVALQGSLPVGAVRLSGFVESDFLNPVADSAPWRWRQYWASAHLGGWQILGGQAWSLLRPNRKGVTAERALMNTDVIEPAYHVGLAGSRRRQVRLVRQFGRQHLAAAWENNGNYIAKLTTDRESGHLELAGFHGRSGRQGVSLAGILGTGRTRFVTQQLWSKRALNEALNLVPAHVGGLSTLEGIEYQLHRSVEVYSYAGMVYGGRSTGNRTVRQCSTGVNYRVNTPSLYGSMTFSVQYSYVDRSLWPGQSGALHYVMYRMRYTFNH